MQFLFTEGHVFGALIMMVMFGGVFALSTHRHPLQTREGHKTFGWSWLVLSLANLAIFAQTAAYSSTIAIGTASLAFALLVALALAFFAGLKSADHLLIARRMK